MFEPFRPFLASAYQIKFATEAWEKEGAAALRRQVFCTEQGLFNGDDRDAVDDTAIPIVAISLFGIAADAVVGTVRIHPHPEDPGVEVEVLLGRSGDGGNVMQSVDVSRGVWH